jgi:tRNA pseudouridine32 synthase/23S rRNA pseudouridine746 synthase
MSTSGLLVLAKHKEAHQFVQDQFIRQKVHKRYTALLEDVLYTEDGLIDLPLRVDLDDRPRQVVCYDYGKPAQTKYKIVAIENGKTRIHFFPLTGRTHQLRVHAAHSLGLHTPIVGDDLYGRRANRLHLHAGYIRFVHPGTRVEITFEIADPF